MTAKRENSFLKWLAQPEAMIGLSAVMVSVIAVAVSVYEARIMRASQRAAVWPYVQLSRSAFYDREELEATGETTWTLTLNAENVGVGPAQVRDFRVSVDGENYSTWGDAMRAIVGDSAEISYGQSTIFGSILPAGRNLQMFSLRDKEIAKRIYDGMDNLDFEICYCSVFDQCWVSRYRDFGGAEPVKSCSPGDASFQE